MTKVNSVLIDRFPHPGVAFTEGLAILRENHDERIVLESTGMWGISQVRALRMINSSYTKVEMSRPLDPNTFGEGLAIWRNSILQLTYKRGVLAVFDRNMMEKKCEISYPSNSFQEGWGLYYDSDVTNRLYVTDGTDRIYVVRFEGCDADLVTETELRVSQDGISIQGLNDITFDPVNKLFWVVIDKSKCVVGIDAESGVAIRWIDMSKYGPRSTLFEKAGDMNGIAMDTTSRHIFLTGKNWPYIYELSLENSRSDDDSRRFHELCGTADGRHGLRGSDGLGGVLMNSDDNAFSIMGNALSPLLYVNHHH